MENKKEKRNVKITVLIIFIIFLLGIIIYNLYLMYKNIDITNNSKYISSRTSVSTDYSQNVESVSQKSTSVADMLEDLTQSVVGISRLTSIGGSILNNVSSEELGQGTGIIITDNGYILSNSHVTGDKYSTCYVTVNEKQYKGTVEWSDPNLDLSITKIMANNLKCVSLGDSSKTRIGEQVYAIGNPIGYEFRRTVTSGIISALNRTIKLIENGEEIVVSDLIQTDATINPGNSGGPLINSVGEVIGINTIKITSAEGIGFAIPINVIKPVVERFKEEGKFEEATLGIYAYDGKLAEYMDFKKKIDRGVYVSKVTIDGPAYKSGLKEGDLIETIDGNKLETINDLRSYIYSKKPKDEVNLSIIRNEMTIELNVILGKK